MKLYVIIVAASLTFSVSAGDQSFADAPKTAKGGQPPQADAWPPRERLLKWNPGVQGGIPSVPVASKLSLADLPTDGETDISAKLQCALDRVKTPGAVLLPAGTFLLAKQVNLKSGVVLRGAGLDKTHLIVRDPSPKGWPIQGGLQVSGRRGDQTKLQITAGATLGSRQLTLAAPKDLQAGQLICIYLKNNDMGQIVRLTKVTGDTVTLEQPLRFTCGPAANLGLRRLTPVTGVGIEDLHVRREDQSECSIIGFYCAENCWVRGCETEFCMKYHIQASLSRYVTIENCYVHHAHHQGGAGHGYGVELDDWTADCLVQNNLFHTLRHAMVVQNGANGCVFAYNYSFDTFGSGDTGPPLYHSAPPWFHSGDIENHGGYAYADLYEGNVAEMADVGCLGPAGPRNTLFRNRIAAPEKAYDLEHYKKLGGTHTFYLSIVIVADTKETNVIGNTITEDARATMKTIIDRASRDDTLVEGNLVDGKMQWNKAQPAPLPASLFLTAKPAFWGEKPWPGIGADADRQTMSTLPAQDWHARIKQAGHSVPFANPARAGSN